MRHLFWVGILVILGAGLTLQRVAGQEPEMYKLVGFATVNGTTTGGAGGDTITVYTGTELQDALKAKKNSTKPLVILVEGTINPENSTDLSKIDVKEVQDVSIIGTGPGADFNGIGLKVFRASNIILRNLKVHHVLIGEKDCISIEGPADHIWVDHCEIYNEYQGVDKDYYDGLLDAKSDCEYITYSWNFLHDSWKTALVGFSESDIFDRKLTMHHNYFLNCNSRLPLFRASTGHFFNNYYKDITSTTINARINACVRIENNYFENANNPWVSAYSVVLGGGEPIGNILVNSPFVYSSDTYELPPCTPEIPYIYSSVLHDAAAVPDLVKTFAGVGKLDIGTEPVYTLSTSISGSGILDIEPFKAFYDSGEVVVITATPDPDWEFNGWSGSETGTENPISITMDVNKYVEASFSTSKFALFYSQSGPGVIVFNPEHQMLYDSGTVVTVTATPYEGAYFLEWTGDLSGSENPVSLSIDSTMEIAAVFRFNETADLEVQVEEWFCALNGSVETEHAGYTGSGFIDFTNETGSEIEFRVTALENTACTMGARYAHGKTDDRSMEVLVNGALQVSNLNFPPTGAFTTWETVTSELTLRAGINIIKFVSLTGNGGPNLDRIDLKTTASLLSYGDCNEDTTTSINSAVSNMTFRIYPNPVSGEGRIDFSIDEPGEAVLSLVSITGARTVLYSGYVDGQTIHSTRISTDGFSSGIYMVELLSGNKRIVSTIVISNQ